MFAGQMPADDFSRKKIHDNAQIVPFAASPEIGEITGPDEIGSFLVKLLVEMIVTAALLLMNRAAGFKGGDFGQVHRTHQALHSANTNGNAIITTEDISDFVSPKTFIVVRIDL